MEKVKLTKVIVILTVITSIVTVINVIYIYLIPTYLLYKWQMEASKASSIAIIGGPDGPTVIYVTGQPSLHMVNFIFAFLSIAGIVYLIFAKKALK